MNNINEMLDILALSETKGGIYLEDIMEKFSCSKRTAYRRIEELMQVLPVEKNDYNKSYKVVLAAPCLVAEPISSLSNKHITFTVPFAGTSDNNAFKRP